VGSPAQARVHPCVDPLLFCLSVPGRIQVPGQSSKMTLHVQGQVVRAGKGTRAESAAEGTLTCVLPVVAGQLIRAREPPAAAIPGAGIWLLP
jgi:hypothetical protein